LIREDRLGSILRSQFEDQGKEKERGWSLDMIYKKRILTFRLRQGLELGRFEE
jgi:hypothetical protein